MRLLHNNKDEKKSNIIGENSDSSGRLLGDMDWEANQGRRDKP